MKLNPSGQPPCGYPWADGWGPHECHLNQHHTGKHRCACDANTWDAEDKEAA